MMTTEMQLSNNEQILEQYFKQLPSWSKFKDRYKIMTEGEKALNALSNLNQVKQEAKICADIALAALHLNELDEVCRYARQCQRLSKPFKNSSLLLQAFYLESVAIRLYASKNSDKEEQLALYIYGEELLNKALKIYFKKGMHDEKIKGKIYYNRGALYADNSKGDLNQAEKDYYKAINCFKRTHAKKYYLSTNLRLGRVFLLKRNYLKVEKIITKMRLFTKKEADLIALDYLEAQLNLGKNDIFGAIDAINNGLNRSNEHGSFEDQKKFNLLMDEIISPINRVD